MIKPAPRHYAFIDSQNINLGVQHLGWKLNFQRFFVYLRDKYGVSKAFLFIGRVKGKESLYQALGSYGYTLVFKEVVIGQGGKIKGNVDAELVLHSMIELPNYDKAVIVTSDGDFACLVEYLQTQDKLGAVLSPSPRYCSALLKRASRKKMRFFDDLRGKLAYKE